MGKTSGKGMKWALSACALVLVGAAAVFAFSIPGLGSHEKVRQVNGAITIPVAGVSDGEAHFYRYPDGGKELKFFLVKGKDGAIRAAFDACDVCFKEKKGYAQQGDAMVCRNCNQRFAIGRLGPHAVGGCNPSYLPHRQVAGNIIISVNDLKTGSKLF